MSVTPRLEHLCRRIAAADCAPGVLPDVALALALVGHAPVGVLGGWISAGSGGGPYCHHQLIHPQAGPQGPPPGPRQALRTPHFFHYRRVTAASFERKQNKRLEKQGECVYQHMTHNSLNLRAPVHHGGTLYLLSRDQKTLPLMASPAPLLPG